MKSIDRYMILFGLAFGLGGLLLGEHMGRTQMHGQLPTHAHIMLVGFVIPCVYGVIYRLWPALKEGWLVPVQAGLHWLGTIGLIQSLYVMYDGEDGDPILPVLIFSVNAVILAWLMFGVRFFLKSAKG